MAIGQPHPDHLEAILTVDQFADWQEYHNCYGNLTRRRHDHVLTFMAKVLYGANTDDKAPEVRYEDLLPYDPPAEPQTPQQAIAIIRTAKRLAKRT